MRPVAQAYSSVGSFVVWRAGIRWLAILGILLCVVARPVSAAEPNAKNVLVLFSFFERNPVSLEAIESSLRAHVAWPVDFSVEYLENPRFYEVVYRESLAETIRRGYSGKKLDLVIVASSPGLQFALEYRDKMFPGVPIVFFGTSNVPADLKMWPGVTGVKSIVAPRETIDLALHLHPDTTAVAVITNISLELERSWFAAVHSELLRHQDKVEEVDVIANGQMLERVAALPAHTVVLFQLFPQDSFSQRPQTGMSWLQSHSVCRPIPSSKGSV